MELIYVKNTYDIIFTKLTKKILFLLHISINMINL